MANYMIGYDLNRPGQDYSELIAAIKGIGNGWWHCLDSTWIVPTTRTSVQIRDALIPYIDASDELLVVQLTKGDAAWDGFDEECSSWLKSNL